MTCSWCKLPTGSTKKAIHSSCTKEMKLENIQIKPLFDKLWLTCKNDRMDIEIKESDIPKDIYFKIKNRDVSKLTRNQTLNNELGILNNLPDEE